MRKSTNPDFKFLSRYVPKCELQVLKENLKGEEGEYFKNLLCNLKEKIKAVPPLYATDGQGNKAPVKLHYFYGATDIYITEIDHETGEGFGFVCLNGDRYNAELGYVNVNEFLSHPLMNLDLYFDDSITIGEIVNKYKS